MPSSSRPHLHSVRPVPPVPPGARNPAITSPIDSWTPYLERPRPDDQARYWPYAEGSSRLRVPDRPPGRPASLYEAETESTLTFPEPMGRSTSYNPSLTTPYPSNHRPSRSDVGLPELVSRRESLDYSIESETSEVSSLAQELSDMNLASEEGLRKFQAGKLQESEREWHRLVPPEAREALGKKEVERQSVIFEVIKAEQDYVNDLLLVKEVFIDPLLAYDPPVMEKNRLRGFVNEVFYNINTITVHHQRMLQALFERQRDQHPLVQSISDIALDTSLRFRDDYEAYIKHYPLAEARHRAELKRNRDYQYFMQQQAQDPRVRKHDLRTFLSRPVTRLPRLSLVLEHILKLAAPDHPDRETLPLTLGILSDFIKSTQPGIEAADSKAKFWDLCESLVFVKGEIIDMDLYDEKRTIVHAGTLARRQRSETDWRGWNDYYVAILDNYLLITKEDTRMISSTKRHVVSRPIPLEYLKLGSFDEPSERRGERPENPGLLSFRSEYRPVWPFTIYHASSKSSRRYTLYADSEKSRAEWYDKLSNALLIRTVNQESNMYFAPQVIHDGYFRVASARMTLPTPPTYTGRINCGATFGSGGRRFVVVGCTSDIYVAQKGMPQWQRVLALANAISMIALPDFNKLVIHQENALWTCSLDHLARAALSGEQARQDVRSTLNRLTSSDENVMFFKAGQVSNRTIIMYATKSLLQVNLHALEVVKVDQSVNATRSANPKPFRPFGEPVSMPKDIRDITTLVRTIAVCGDKGILVVDPTNLSKSTMTVVPDFRGSGNNLPMSTLKSRCDGSKPIGIARCDASELLVIYDELGCYVTKHGVPSRSCGYVRWETKATSFTHRGRHILLFSPGYIEIREISTGRLVQVLEGDDIRLLHTGLDKCGEGRDELLAVMRGTRDDRDGVSEKIVELFQTAELDLTPLSSQAAQGVWDEWDMAG